MGTFKYYGSLRFFKYFADIVFYNLLANFGSFRFEEIVIELSTKPLIDFLKFFKTLFSTAIIYIIYLRISSLINLFIYFLYFFFGFRIFRVSFITSYIRIR